MLPVSISTTDLTARQRLNNDIHGLVLLYITHQLYISSDYTLFYSLLDSYLSLSQFMGVVGGFTGSTPQ